MKQIAVISFFLFASSFLMAQKKPATEKVVNTAEKINNKTRQVGEASEKVSAQITQAGDNAKVIVDNAKKIVRVFEPILQHFKKKKGNVTKTGTPEFSSYPSAPPPVSNSENFPGSGSETGASGFPSVPDYGTPESEEYNNDGSANWGNQHNAVFGNFLDALTGSILDAESAEQNPQSVDLIFLAPSDGQNAYYLITPDFARNNLSADAFWGSATTDNPVKRWNDVNESEIAETKITGAQFFKITTNSQIISAVKSVRGYASFYSSTSKLDGKVFAVKTNMHNRDAYALIYIAKHIGTSGSNGCLKIFIKCNGIDNNVDGFPEPANYERNDR